MYSRLKLSFVFTRNIGFYIIQIYLPSTLIVIISWVSFWLSRDATPARVALGVTTVLTMTTLMSTTNSSMPKVSYIKSIDLYLGVCFIMVFASLLEYAAVGYLNKRLRMKREKKLRKMETHTNAEYPSSHDRQYSSTAKSGLRRRHFGDKAMPRIFSKAFGENSVLSSGPRLHMTPASALSGFSGGRITPPNEVECDCDLEKGPTPYSQPTLKVPKHHKSRKRSFLAPSTIDKYSRMIFPLLFTIFNVIYWSVNRYLSNLEKERYMKVPFFNETALNETHCKPKVTRY